jgi:hypothetical protein
MSSEGAGQFQKAVREMEPLFAELQASPKHRVADHPAVPDAPGIYLFSEGGRPVYVGQSRKLRTRLKQHTGVTRDQNQASFAFNLAKREAARAGLDIERWRKVLQADPAFTPHFDAARAQVAAMDVQFIELPDPITRTLFEVYAALALDTAEFNSFETH